MSLNFVLEVWGFLVTVLGFYRINVEEEDEDLFQPALKNEDVNNSIFFHVKE